MKFRRFSLVVAAALAVGAPAFATTMLKLDVPAMSRAADAVVRGKVTKVQSRWTDDQRKIVTDVELQVSETLKGSPPKTVKIVQPGGVVGDIGQRVDGVAEFKEGEECVVFLERQGDKVFSVVGMAQGKLKVERSSDGKASFAVPSDVNAMLVDPVTREQVAPSMTPVPLETLRTTVQSSGKTP